MGSQCAPGRLIAHSTITSLFLLALIWFVLVPVARADFDTPAVEAAAVYDQQISRKNKLRQRWLGAIRDARTTHAAMCSREETETDPAELQEFDRQRQLLIRRLSRILAKCNRSFGVKDRLCLKAKKLRKKLRKYRRRPPLPTPASTPTVTPTPSISPPQDEEGWTVFSPTPLDTQTLPVTDAKQIGSRIIYISKTNSPAVLWDSSVTYRIGDVVVYPATKADVNGPSVRDAFWKADGTQALGMPPGPDVPGWTAVADPGVVYFWNGSQVVDAAGRSYGSDPFNPQGIVSFFSYGTSKAEISAWGNLRSGYADWCLFARGESWTAGVDQFTAFRSIGGRSPTEPSLHGAFGPLTADRPRFLWQSTTFFTDWYGNRYDKFISIWFNRNPIRGNLAFVSLAFEPKDPAAEARGAGVSVIGAWSDPVLMDNILFEDLKIDGTEYGFLFQWLATQQDQPGSLEYNFGITIRRSIVTNVWNANSHNQGMFVTRVARVLVEDSIFHRNGYKGDPRIDDTRRDIFSRNFYLSTCDQMAITLRETISSNGGSGGPQMRCGGTLERSLILNEGNAFTAAQTGSTVLDWAGQQQGSSYLVRDNVMFKWRATGTRDDRSHPGWGFTIQSGAFGGEVYGNIFSGQHMLLNGTGEPSAYAVRFSGSEESMPLTARNSVHNNISFRAGPIDVSDPTGLTSSGFAANTIVSQFQCAGTSAATDTFFTKNRCYTNNSLPYRSGSSNLSYEQFLSSAVSADDGTSTVSPLESAAATEGWSAPDRSIRTYMESLGHSVQSSDGTQEFMARCVEQRKGNWHSEFTAGAVVDYVRAGFGLTP